MMDIVHQNLCFMKKLIYALSIGCALMVGSGAYNTVSAQEVKEKYKTKKPMNKKTKYALIGTGVGVGTGVLTSKNDSKGAVIGGALGAGAGYLYGRHREKKNPTPKTKRVYKYKKES
jgi:hypothetical protein